MCFRIRPNKDAEQNLSKLWQFTGQAQQVRGPERDPAKPRRREGKKGLERRGLTVERQKPVNFEYDGMLFEEGLRVDLLVNDIFLVELKSVEAFAPVHPKQLRTYLRLMRLPLGLLINFGAATFKEGVKRVVNNHTQFAASRLRVNQDLPHE